MTTELTRYNGYRYVLRKGPSFTGDADKIKAGRAMLMHADMVVWESNAALVARVESFLQTGFSWYSRYPKSARDTLQTLLAYVRDGAVIVSQGMERPLAFSKTAAFRLTRQRKRRDDPSRRWTTTRGWQKMPRRCVNTMMLSTRGSSENGG